MRQWVWLALSAMLLAVSMTVLAGASQVRAQTGAAMDARLVEALQGAGGPVELIVTFHGDEAPSAEQVELLRALGLTGGVTLHSLPMAAVLATRAQVEALAAHPDVRSLYLNRALQYENDGATEITGVDRLRSDSDLTTQNGGLPVTGKGIGVVVNDSGVDGTHKDLEFGRNLVQNVAGNLNLHALSELLPVTYVENVPNTDSTGGHGTHVAGIVGGTGAMSGGKYEGVAPGAALVGYGSGAAIAILDVLTAFDYAVTHQMEYNIRVVTNSWGDTSDAGTPFDPNDPINIATKKCFDRNIVVVFSAGNSGPAEGTISGNYKKAPWVVTVAAGDKQGGLTDFSSRGLKDHGGTVTVGGKSFTWEDRPTVTAPGNLIISTRVVAPVSSLGATDDLEMIEPAYLPYYTTMSGTSMAAPHVAGIVALMLDANPALTPTQVKQILQETATNMPGMEAWEVGAGYVNAYAAVDRAFTAKPYGQTLNLGRSFNANVQLSVENSPFTATFDPVAGRSEPVPVEVGEGVAELVAKVDATGLLGQTGNTINLVATAPDGTRYSSGIYVLFPLYTDRAISVNNPMPGTWTIQLEGLDGVALPEEVSGTLTLKRDAGYTGLNDIAGHPAETAIKLAVSNRLVDGDSARNFRPDEVLTRIDLARYLVMGTGVRQSLPASPSFTDVKSADRPFAEAVAARGAALKDAAQTDRGVMLPTGSASFSPKLSVRRADLAYSLVQSLGLEAEALERAGQSLTVQYGDQRILIGDADQVDAELRGYVQLALDLNILNAYFTSVQGPFDLQPTILASFKPQAQVSRADYAVAITRFFNAYLSQ